MAITITKSPKQYTPSDNPVLWVFDSDNTGQTNFSYKVEVYINGSVVKEAQVFPTNGTSSYYDASGITRMNCSTPAIDEPISYSAANNAEIYLVITERYGATPVDQDNETTSTVIFYKAKVDDKTFYTWNLALIEDKFITQHERDYVIKPGEKIRFMVLNKQADIDINYSFYKNGVPTPVVSFTDAYANSNEFTIINPERNTLIENGYMTGVQYDGSDYFTIQVSDGITTPTYTVTIDRNICYQDSYKRLHVISRIGSIESFSFDLVSVPENTFTSEGYKVQNLDTTTLPNAIDFDKGTNITSVKQSQNKLVVNSNWLTDSDELLIRREFLFNPLVYIESNVTLLGLERVRVINTSAKRRRTLTNMTYRFVLTLETRSETSMIV